MASILGDKSLQFALSIIEVYKLLVSEKKEFVLSKQVLRSGTSIGANIREAQNAESKMDFIHKLAIAQKECDETLYWLELLFKSNYLQQDKYDEMSGKAHEIIKMLRSSILTVKSKLKKM